MEGPASIADLDNALASLRRVIQFSQPPDDYEQLSVDQKTTVSQMQLYTNDVLQIITTLKDIKERMHAQYAKWNQQHGTGLFPPEILCRVFKFAAAYDRSMSLCRLTHVCRRWRYIAIHDPSLWSHFRINVSTKGAEYAETLLQRSASLPISVDLLCSERQMEQRDRAERFSSVVLNQHHRIRSLMLPKSSIAPSNFDSIFARHGARSWENLERLLVDDVYMDFPWWDVPHLQFLSISSFKSQRASPSSICLATLHSLRVQGYGPFSLADWSSALSHMPLLEELYLDISNGSSRAPFPEPTSLALSHTQRTEAIKLDALRRLTLGLRSPQHVEFMLRLTYPQDVLVTLLLQIFRSHALVPYLETAVRIVRRQIGLQPTVPIARWCHFGCKEIAKGDDPTLQFTFHPRSNSPPCLQFSIVEQYRLVPSVYSTIFSVVNDQEVQVLEVSLHDFKSIALNNSMRDKPFMRNVRWLQVPCVEIIDAESLLMRNALGQIALPNLKTIIIDPSLLQTPEVGGRRKRPTAGVLKALTLRRAQGFPIEKIVLGPQAQSTQLLNDISRLLPELRVTLAPRGALS
ncbi:hypothetical protein EIP86_006591 [Pleurotus ostreatoroseus]|nr:hypothetical protein EIP86_006591 [Pleurotus ostreatoroseus]